MPHFRRLAMTYSGVSRPLATWSGDAWSQTSPISAASPSPPWPRSREVGHTSRRTNVRERGFQSRRPASHTESA